MRQARIQWLSIGLIAALTALSFCGLGSVANAGDVLFKRHVLNGQTDYCAAALIDVNHDGRLDVVCGGHWYENPNWNKHFVAEIPRIGGRPDGFAHLEFDVNRDGWVDVITVNYRSASIKWMEHPGAALGPWKTHIAVEPGPMETGRLVDIDGDGQLDLLPNGANFAAWWEFRWNEPKGVGEPAWIRHDLPKEAGGHGLGFGDVDGDGRGDVVGQFGWLSAPDDARNGQWQWHPDFRIERGSIPMLAVDADTDGDLDIVWCSAHGFGVYWLEQLKDVHGSRRWHRHAIDTSWSQGHSPLWADMDGDGRNELIAGKRYMAHGGADPGEYDPIVSFRYQFNPKSRTWDRWLLSPVGDRVGLGLDPKVADIDGDGDLDLMASGRSGVYWLENLGQGNSATLSPALPEYADHQTLLVTKNASGETKVVTEPEGWGLRRSHVVAAIERTHGKIPGSSERSPLNISSERDASNQKVKTQQIRYSLDAHRQTTASLLTPNSASLGAAAGIVCMFEPNNRELAQQVAVDLAARGFVCIVPTLLESQGVSDGVWQAMRAADVLQSTDRVHGERLGFVGDAVQGQLGMYVAALDQRFMATLVDASRATELFGLSQPDSYSLAELLAAAAPRALNVVAPVDAGSASALKNHSQVASAVFALRRVISNLQFTDAALSGEGRASALAWLESAFRQPGRLAPP